ncbi:MAG: signal peptide peptidase SppA [Saprospiraceae bacterium]|nr:signal peptide peptidase SppA [Saprospiraceae bacterium]
MGKFLKFLTASCLGTIIGLAVITGLGFLILTNWASRVNQPQDVEPNSVLVLTFEDPVPERTNNLEMSPFDLKKTKVLGLQEIVETLSVAKEDDNIKGIYLEVDNVQMGYATSTVLRKALLDFRESGKFVLAYSKYYSQGAYYLSSAADEVFINPAGELQLKGFAVQIPFFKEMLDKLGIDMQTYYAGQFKSATEPYRLNEMSPQNRLQLRELLQTFYAIFLDDVAGARNIDQQQLKQIIADLDAWDPQGAFENGLVDSVAYKDEALNVVREKLGLDENDEITSISMVAYHAGNKPVKNYSARNKVAVIYAEGTIVDGDGEVGSIGDLSYAKHIRELRRDDAVEAIVLRVNSPGGSALASENIWRELSLAREEGIPVVVSMGDLAASGGYYISCMADTIVAEPNTLTGSIGVFTIIPSFEELLNEKVGIDFDTVKTAPFADGLYNTVYDMSDEKARLIQRETERTYETFLQRVADGRGMSRDAVHEIAQGRVWTGRKALELGLVDTLGNLDQALDIAVKMAGLEEYRLTEYPEIKDPLQQIMEELTGGGERRIRAEMKEQLGEWYPYYSQIRDIKSYSGTQARLPFFFPWN